MKYLSILFVLITMSVSAQDTLSVQKEVLLKSSYFNKVQLDTMSSKDVSKAFNYFTKNIHNSRMKFALNYVKTKLELQGVNVKGCIIESLKRFHNRGEVNSTKYYREAISKLKRKALNNTHIVEKTIVKSYIAAIISFEGESEEDYKSLVSLIQYYKD